MRILCGYSTIANLEPETYRSLILYGLRQNVPVDFVDVSGDPSNYWKAICARWTGEQDLVIVEQDNVITEETLPSFWACDQDWCVFWYRGWAGFEDDKLKHSLGCTRFSAALQRKFPHVMIAGPKMAWHGIDFAFEQFLTIRGYDSHIHGEVKHLHDYVNDPKFARPHIVMLADGTVRVTTMQPDGTFKTFIE